MYPMKIIERASIDSSVCVGVVGTVDKEGGNQFSYSSKVSQYIM